MPVFSDMKFDGNKLNLIFDLNCIFKDLMILPADLFNYSIIFQFFPEFRKTLLETQGK